MIRPALSVQQPNPVRPIRWGRACLQQAQAELSRQPEQANPNLAQDTLPPPQAAPILVVEDDVAVQTMLYMALEDANYPVELARNGAEALKQLATIRPRLILLDMRMPVMDGTAFLRALYSQADYPIPPVIIMTAYREIDPAALEFGLPAINKPMNIERLIQLIEQYTPLD